MMHNGKSQKSKKICEEDLEKHAMFKRDANLIQKALMRHADISSPVRMLWFKVLWQAVVDSRTYVTNITTPASARLEACAFLFGGGRVVDVCNACGLDYRFVLVMLEAAGVVDDR